MESAPNPPEASTLKQQDELLESIPVEPKAESADQKNDASKSQESSETLVKQTENKAEAADDTTAAATDATASTNGTTVVVPSTDDKNPDDQQAAPPAPLSKKALKRQKRWDHKLVLKKRRKEHTKEAKRAQAVLDGRDMDDEKRDVEERTKDGEGHRRREKVSFCLFLLRRSFLK